MQAETPGSSASLPMLSFQHDSSHPTVSSSKKRSSQSHPSTASLSQQQGQGQDRGQFQDTPSYTVPSQHPPSILVASHKATSSHPHDLNKHGVSQRLNVPSSSTMNTTTPMTFLSPASAAIHAAAQFQTPNSAAIAASMAYQQAMHVQHQTHKNHVHPQQQQQQQQQQHDYAYFAPKNTTLDATSPMASWSMTNNASGQITSTGNDIYSLADSTSLGPASGFANARRLSAEDAAVLAKVLESTRSSSSHPS